MYSTILITGGAGFVGSNLGIKLKQNFPDCHIIAFDNLKRRGSELILKRLMSEHVRFEHGDIRNKEDLESIGPVDLIIDCSAEPSVAAGVESSPNYLINTNLLGTINCLEAARKYQSDLLFLSTSRVYPIEPLRQIGYQMNEDRFILSGNEAQTGISDENGINENFTLTGHRSLYGATKLASELLIEEYRANFNLGTIINRCGVIAGPWQMGKVDQGFLVHWVSQHMFNGKLAYFGYEGSGKQVRDVLHINDLFELVKIQIENPQQYHGETFNVGGGLKSSTSLKELTQLCSSITDKDLDIGQAPHPNKLDVPIYITDNQKITQLSGWQPQKSMTDTVSDIHKWIIDNEPLLKPLFKT